MTQEPAKPWVWPQPDLGVTVSVRQIGALSWQYTITQEGSSIASIGSALTRRGAHVASARRLRSLRLDVERRLAAETFEL